VDRDEPLAVPWWDDLQADLQADARALVAYIEARGGTARVTSTRRSLAAERRLLRSAGVEPDGLVSAHHFGRALDIEIHPRHLLPAAVALWRDMGHKWRPSDPIHFEQ
jgi:hypothetical protein